MQVLCWACHEEKTAAEAGARVDRRSALRVIESEDRGSSDARMVSSKITSAALTTTLEIFYASA